jgi:hypothetical protein
MRSILASYGRLLITTNENAGQRIRMRARHALYSATCAGGEGVERPSEAAQITPVGTVAGLPAGLDPMCRTGRRLGSQV